MRLETKNVRGFTPEKLEMIIHTMEDRGIHAAALQKAWAAVSSGRDNELNQIKSNLILSRWLWERGKKGGASLQKQARARNAKLL